MGYTHYWKYYPKDNKTTEKQFKLVLKDCEKIMKAKPTDIGIFGWDEQKQGFFGEPEFNPLLICINGDESKNLNHESFYFNPFEKTDFDFCKTARKPYDVVVCAILISLANRLDGFSFGSDGGMEKDEWIPAFKLYRDAGLRLKKGVKAKMVSSIIKKSMRSVEIY